MSKSKLHILPLTTTVHNLIFYNYDYDPLNTSDVPSLSEDFFL